MEMNDLNSRKIDMLLGTFLINFEYFDTQTKLLLLIAVSTFKTAQKVSNMYADLSTLKNLYGKGVQL